MSTLINHVTEKSHLKSLSLPVDGMSCASCVGRVEKALAGLDGVSHASVNLTTERASVDFNPKDTGPAAIAEAIEQAGFSVPAASVAGKMLGDRAKAAGIRKVVFDRGGYAYHGRVRAVADAAREVGLEF